MNTRQKRLDILKKLMTSGRAGSQEDILRMLAGKGFSVTQATLSRDLKTLKVAKIPDGHGSYRYVLPGTLDGGHSDPVPVSRTASAHLVASVRSIEFSGQMGVLKTKPGYANMVASILDSGLGGKIMGTVAGDDTVLLILRADTDTMKLLSEMEQAIPGISVRRI